MTPEGAAANAQGELQPTVRAILGLGYPRVL
jgi:hypothetical protein